MSTLELLTTRRSVKAKDMIEPGPNQEQIRTILQAGHRVPDHGKIGPWRFVVFRGHARAQFTEKLAEIYAEENPDCKEKKLNFQSEVLMRAPVAIAVISTASQHAKVPEWEQVLSVGAVCQNMLIAATAMGFGAQWLTEWYSYNDRVKALLEMEPHHRVAGFLYFGNFEHKPEERKRPDLEERITYWGE